MDTQNKQIKEVTLTFQEQYFSVGSFHVM